MRITIFGASRGVGRAAVDAGLASGHTITAFARTGGTLAATAARVVAGDVLDAAVVRSALAGSGAVLIALGVTPGRRGQTPETVCSQGTATILTAMHAESIERLVVVTSYGVGPTKALTPFPFNLIAATVLKGIMADKEEQERAVRASGLAWTIVQPLGLTDDPPSGSPLTSTDGSKASNRVARADVAAVCIDAIERGAFVGESVAVSARA